MKRIVVDTLGSDQGPKAVLEGVKAVLSEVEDVHITIVGDPELVKEYELPEGRYNVIEAHETVTNYDNPVQAFYKAEKVSIFLALKEASENDDVIGVISSGFTPFILLSIILSFVSAVTLIHI